MLRMAENTIKVLCEKKVVTLYGKTSFCSARLNQELNFMEKGDTALSLLICKEISDYSNALGFPIFIPTSLSGVFIAYLLGFSNINPLPPHYLCLNCRYCKVETSVFDKYELSEKKCPSCGKAMITDGHGISIKMHYRQKDLVLNEIKCKADFDLRVAPSVREKIVQHLNKRFMDLTFSFGHENNSSVRETDLVYYPNGEISHLKTKHSTKSTDAHFCKFSPLHGKLAIADNWHLEIIGKASKESGIDYKRIPLDDTSIYSDFSIDDFEYPFMLCNNQLKDILDVVKPSNLYELSRVMGFALGQNVWEENSQNAIATSFPATREEMYCLLKQYKMPPDEAFAVMLFVLIKGQHSFANSEIKEYVQKADLPQWFKEYCEKTHYLFPKPHVIGRAKIAYLLAWYKKYYSEYFN